MKVLDVIGTGAKKAAQAVAQALAGPGKVDHEELRRRAEANARRAARRAEREAELFGTSRWLMRRPGWLGRRR